MGKQAQKRNIFRGIPHTWMKLAGRQTIKATNAALNSIPCEKEVQAMIACQEKYEDDFYKITCKEFIVALSDCVTKR
jgi:hypothetical protein